MKLKHNKKRNTAFLFESLVRELTKTSLKNDNARKKKIMTVIKEFFNKKTVLYSELQLYKSLCENISLDPGLAGKVLQEAKDRHQILNKKDIFNSQTKLIRKINESLGKDVFDNFISNYKDLATAYQIFYKSGNVKSQVKLEQQIVERLQKTTKDVEKQKYKPVSKLAFKNFFNKFNDTYKDSLMNEQKDLIQHYINSFEQDELEFKVFLNEELGRLKNKLSNISTDNKNKLVIEKREALLGVLDSFKNKEIDSNILEKILKTQQVVKEITDNGN
jgi:hypothetical protein